MEPLAVNSSKSSPRHFQQITAILVWCGLIVVSSLYITLPLVSELANQFQATPTLAAWTGSAFSLAYAVGFLIFGPLSERFGRKQVMLSGLVLLALITPLIGLASNLLALIALRAIQGLAAATFAPSALAYIAEVYPIEKRITTVGFVSTGFLVAGIAGQVFSSLVSQGIGWSYVFYSLGLLYLISVILLGVILPKTKIHRPAGNLLASFTQMGTVLFQKSLAICYLITATLLMSFVGMYTALGSFLSHPPFELTADQILGVRAMGVVGMVLSPFAGLLVRRFGMKTTLRIGLALAVCGLAVIGVSTQLSVLIAMSILFVAGISITVPTLISWVGYLAGTARGAAVTMYMFILFVGATLGPILTLKLLQTGSYVLAFETLAVLLFFSWVGTFLVKNQSG